MHPFYWDKNKADKKIQLSDKKERKKKPDYTYHTQDMISLFLLKQVYFFFFLQIMHTQKNKTSRRYFAPAPPPPSSHPIPFT